MAVPPSALKDLVKLPVAAKWKQLGLQLGVPMHRLQQIQANNSSYPDSTQECLTDMFDWWLNNGRGKTYERLARALSTIGKRELARQFHESGEISCFFLIATICFIISSRKPTRSLVRFCTNHSLDLRAGRRSFFIISYSNTTYTRKSTAFQP